MADRNEAGGRGATGAALINERSWLAALTLSRAFISLIFMTYAASLPTLSREWAMTGDPGRAGADLLHRRLWRLAVPDLVAG